MKEEHQNDERMIVLVCWKCGKLIGTRENYYIHSMNYIHIEKNKKTKKMTMDVVLCEGCHD